MPAACANPGKQWDTSTKPRSKEHMHFMRASPFVAVSRRVAALGECCRPRARCMWCDPPLLFSCARNVLGGASVDQRCETVTPRLHVLRGLERGPCEAA